MSINVLVYRLQHREEIDEDNTKKRFIDSNITVFPLQI